MGATASSWNLIQKQGRGLMRAFNQLIVLSMLFGTLCLPSAYGSAVDKEVLAEDVQLLSAGASTSPVGEPVSPYTASTFLNVGAVLPRRAIVGDVWEKGFPFHDLEGAVRMLHFTWTFETVTPNRWHARVTCEGARVEMDDFPHGGDGVQFYMRFGIVGGFDPEKCDNVPSQVRLVWEGGKEQTLKLGIGGFTQTDREWGMAYAHDGCGFRFNCVAPPPNAMEEAIAIAREAATSAQRGARTKTGGHHFVHQDTSWP
ncbi:MAG: hypothetical protein C0514_07765 [Candidatus Puniceispirillum sp.]|nr:hypothetical protein [Candidatus Puniceispirillum sp.]